MKLTKSIFIFLCFGMLAFFSCNKVASSGDSINQNKIKALLRLSQAEQKVSYGLLTASEKKTAWLEKFNTVLKSENLTGEQAAIINKSIGFINTISFSEQTFDNEKVAILDNIRKESIMVFGFDKAYDIFATLSLQQNNIDEDASSNIVEAAPKCNCSKSSDWCLSGKCVDTSPVCPAEGHCGTLWLSTCDGKCNK